MNMPYIAAELTAPALIVPVEIYIGRKNLMKKRFLSLLLVLTMILALLPQLTPGVRAAEQTGKCGANLNWSSD